MRQERVEFQCGQLTLEGVLRLPEGEGPFGVVVVCHPHPQLGGDMRNNVVSAVCMALDAKGLASFKFNFRGVGGSGGSFDNGVGECDDALAAVSFVLGRKEIDPERVGISGYSFGSKVAFQVAVKEQKIRSVAGISPFIEPTDLLDAYTKPKIFLCGTLDGYINTKSLQQQVDKLPEPKELALYPDTDHFWFGQERGMAAKVGDFFADTLQATKNIY